MSLHLPKLPSVIILLIGADKEMDFRLPSSLSCNPRAAPTRSSGPNPGLQVAVYLRGRQFSFVASRMEIDGALKPPPLSIPQVGQSPLF